MTALLKLAAINCPFFYTTWKLWLRLVHPEEHPLYCQMLRLLYRGGAGAPVILAALAGVLLMCGGMSLLLRLPSSSLILALGGLAASSSVYVVVWVVQITAAIARQRETSVYDLLCLTPYGEVSAHLATCAAYLHRDDSLGWIDVLRKLAAVSLLIILLLALWVTASRVSSDDLVHLGRLTVEIALTAFLVYYDHVQSVVLGSLVGMLSPVYSRTRINAAVWAGGVFWALQALALVLAALAALALSRRFSTDFGLTLFTLLAFILAREGLIFVLWRLLVRRVTVGSASPRL